MEAGDGMRRWRWIQESALRDGGQQQQKEREKEENGDEFESSGRGRGRGGMHPPTHHSTPFVNTGSRSTEGYIIMSLLDVV
jgi:hypothetical protein